MTELESWFGIGWRWDAASLPTLAKQHGATLVIVNREPTPLDSLADMVINESIGEVMQAWSAGADPESRHPE